MEFSCEFVENQYFVPTIHQSLQINVSKYLGENLAPASPSANFGWACKKKMKKETIGRNKRIKGIYHFFN